LDAEKEVAIKENILNEQNQVVPKSGQKNESVKASQLEYTEAPKVMARKEEECDIDDYPSMWKMKGEVVGRGFSCGETP
jgi:hypothetical protein